MQRQELVKVYKDTLSLTRKTTSHSYKKSDKWSFDDLPPIEDLLDEAANRKKSRPAKIRVINGDTLTVALELHGRDLSPLVLNMASDICPGGGVAKGSRAQEEELFRRSNYNLCCNKSFYPLGADEFVTTDGVAVVKDESYMVLEDHVELDFIAMAGVRKPSLTYSNGHPEYMDDEERELMEQKIDAIFRYAIYQEKDSLVLGALGCGAFGNPPRQVMLMFKNCITRYSMYFTEIVFAVLSHGNNENFKIFSGLLS